MLAFNYLDSEKPILDGPPDPGELTGVLHDIRYHQDGWLIGRLRANNTLTPIVGPCLAPQFGVTYVLTGEYQIHDRFGRQFKFTSFRTELPTAPTAIESYLAASSKWIGPVVAHRIVSQYGADTLRILKDDPDRVAAEINGLTPERAAEVARDLRENELLEAATVGLTAMMAGTGIGEKTIRKALEVWGHQALSVVEADPFRLTDLPGIGFTMADRVRAALKIPHDDQHRIQAGVTHVLAEAASGAGCTFLPDSEFYRTTKQLLGLDTPTITAVLAEMEGLPRIHPGAIHIETHEFMETLCSEIGPRKLWDAEKSIAGKLTAIASGRPSDRLVAQYSSATLNGDGLADDQIAALAKLAPSRIAVLTGSPGTGKTYTIRRIIDSFGASTAIALAAPTGKAAKRMTELTGRPASTIHRLLEPTPDGTDTRGGKRFVFSRNEGNPIAADVVIIDEVSMLDVNLGADLLSAIPANTRVILVGDVNQLPPVGPGNVLRDAIESQAITVAELTTIKRQNPGLLIRNVHAIRDGHNVMIDNTPDADFLWDERGAAADNDEALEEIAATVVDLVSRRIPSLGYDPLRDIQVLAPLTGKKKDANGREIHDPYDRADGSNGASGVHLLRTAGITCKALNRRLQFALNPNRPEGAARFAVGDKVIQTANNYSLGIFNGDIGFVRHVKYTNTTPGGDDRHYAVQFDEPAGRVEVPFKNCALELAYCITIHRSQGSEWPVVVLPLHRSQGSIMLQRPLVYTAISRASKMFVGVGQSLELQKAIKRQRQSRRYTHLGQMLRGGC